MTIKAEEKQLWRIFSDDYLFEIPDYQRPYAWTTEQTGELLDDLLTAMDTDEEAPYFLGSIVLIKDPNNAPAEVRWRSSLVSTALRHSDRHPVQRRQKRSELSVQNRTRSA